jgi:hypothetical protein
VGPSAGRCCRTPTAGTSCERHCPGPSVRRDRWDTFGDSRGPPRTPRSCQRRCSAGSASSSRPLPDLAPSERLEDAWRNWANVSTHFTRARRRPTLAQAHRARARSPRARRAPPAHGNLARISSSSTSFGNVMPVKTGARRTWPMKSPRPAWKPQSLARARSHRLQGVSYSRPDRLLEQYRMDPRNDHR